MQPNIANPLKRKVGRPSVEVKRVTISVRLDPSLLEEVNNIPDLTLTQAVENGLKLVLSRKAISKLK
jgi:hypothetical protein